MRLIGGQASDGTTSDGAAPSESTSTSQPAAPAATPVLARSTPARVLRPDPTLTRPTAFTVEQLAWEPWIEPVELADATPEQLAALEGRTGNSAYFRLLAHEPAVLTERTATDKGIMRPLKNGAPEVGADAS